MYENEIVCYLVTLSKFSTPLMIKLTNRELSTVFCSICSFNSNSKAYNRYKYKRTYCYVCYIVSKLFIAVVILMCRYCDKYEMCLYSAFVASSKLLIRPTF